MKMTFLLSLLAIGQLWATESYSQSTRISLKLENSKISEVLDNIESKSEFFFLYSPKLIDVERKVDISFENKPIHDILDSIFDDKVNFSVTDHQIILTPAYLVDSGQQQKSSVTGTVSDKSGKPIIGATVKVKGTTSGAITDVNGRFTIPNVPENATLIFSFVGMKTVEVIPGTLSNVDIVMDEELISMNEVVVTALGIKREEKALGYAVQKVGGDIVSTVKGVDIGTSLTGKIAGLLVKNSTEFSAEPDISIRGEKPLLVIDGVPYGNMTLRDVPSDDIENISVLKGATASALYGYRGASGAIMITTKKSANKGGLAVSVNSSSMLSAGYLAIPEMQSKYGRVVNTQTNTYSRYDDGSWGVPLDGRQVIQWDPISKSMKAMPYLPIGKDNLKNFLEQGMILNNNINIVQQGELGSFRASATWVRNKGTYPNSTFNKYTYNIAGDIKIKDFTLSSSIAYNKQKSPNIGFNGYTAYDPMYSMLVWGSPDFDIRKYKDYWLVKNESQNSSYVALDNPYFDRNERIHNLDRDVFNGSLSVGYNITSWLKATLRSGFDSYSDHQEVRISEGSYRSAGSATVLLNGTQVWGESYLGSFNTGLGRGYSFNNDFLLTGSKKAGDFMIDGLVGGTIYYKQDEGIEAFTQGGLSIPGFYSIKASVNPIYVNSSIYKQQVNSLMGRLSMSWKSLIYAEGTVRNDWSSTLPKSTRSYLYPSISGSFIASELLPKTEWLSLWKLRGSWTSSKTPAGIYDINSVYTITNNAWGDLSSASYPTVIRGTDVHPESSATFEVGTAVSLYKNRISFDIAYYSKRMYDFLRNAGISPASGYNSNYVNTDEEITRKGLEISANMTVIKSSDWQWNVTLNWSKYAQYYTKIDKVYSEDEPWVKAGKRADAFPIYDYLKDPSGNIIYTNGLPQYSNYLSLYGYSDPDWIWGINSSVTKGNWKLNISFDGRVGGLTPSITEMYMWRSGNHPNSVVPERYLDATNPGTRNFIGKGVKIISGTVTYDTYGNITSDTRVFAPNDVAVTYENYINNYHKGTAWGGTPAPADVYNSTFLKVREVSLTYTLPAAICSKLGAKGVSFSAVGQNVFLWAKQFKFSDPDGGSENFSDPSLRYIGFNLKLDF